MFYNPYNRVLQQGHTAAGGLRDSNLSIDELQAISSSVADTFAICHIALGLKDATCLFNEVLIGIMDEYGNTAVCGDVNVICRGSVESLRVLIGNDRANEKKICAELIDEVMHTRNLCPLTKKLKPVYLEIIDPCYRVG